LFQVDVKEIKCPLQWWNKHEIMFPIMGLLAQHILGIARFHIEAKHIYFLASILQVENLEN
jgi:hypothetical protein